MIHQSNDVFELFDVSDIYSVYRNEFYGTKDGVYSLVHHCTQVEPTNDNFADLSELSRTWLTDLFPSLQHVLPIDWHVVKPKHIEKTLKHWRGEATAALGQAMLSVNPIPHQVMGQKWGSIKIYLEAFIHYRGVLSKGNYGNIQKWLHYIELDSEGHLKPLKGSLDFKEIPLGPPELCYIPFSVQTVHDELATIDKLPPHPPMIMIDSIDPTAKHIKSPLTPLQSHKIMASIKQVSNQSVSYKFPEFPSSIKALPEFSPFIKALQQGKYETTVIHPPKLFPFGAF